MSRLKFVLLPHEIKADSPVGGKARALSELARADLPIPPWVVILPEAFHASLDKDAHQALEQAHTVKAVRAVVDRLSPSAAVIQALQQAIARWGGEDLQLAVRSSALEEDSAARSFAGQLESFLFVSPHELPERVAAVWRSGFSERLIAYRMETGLAPQPQPPAVVIQLMVEGEASGVAFSADPVSGRRAVAVVSAVPGLGCALVSGEANADSWRVGRSGEIIETNIVSKPLAYRRDPGAADGVSAYQLGTQAAEQAALDAQQVAQVAALARQAERFFSRPQDIESTLAGGQLYLLQSRPITGLADKDDPDDVRTIWDNSNIVESYSGITLPLTFSFARRAYENVYREFCRLMRVPPAVLESSENMFCCMLGLISGRVYYNLLNWYRLVGVLPGYRFNRKFMEQMMGVRESLPEPIAERVETPGSGQRLIDGARLLATLWGLLLAFLGLKRRIRRFYARLDDTLGQGRPDLSALRPDELVAYYRHIEQRLLTHWDAPIVNDFATMFFHGLLRRLAVSWLEDRDETLQNDLLSAEPGMISSEPAHRVREMAARVADVPSLAELMCSGGIAEVRAAMGQHAELEQAYQDYLGKFGDRTSEELKLESLTLYDDPTPLLRSIGQYARALQNREPSAGRGSEEAALRLAAEARVGQALQGKPLMRTVFAWVLKNTRNCVRERENLRFERTRVFGRARQILLELGKRLSALEHLESPRDVFYLELDELIAFVESRATLTDLKGLVTLRKAEFERYRSLAAPPERFETLGSAYVGERYLPQAPAPAPVGETLQGIGCSPGVVRGPVRIVRDPRSASVAEGEIIVAEHTDPGWVMIYPAAAGLLVERGSLLSHSAIVARELGLPTIVSIPHLLQWLKDGEWVEMNGGSGTITKLSSREEAKSKEDEAHQ